MKYGWKEEGYVRGGGTASFRSYFSPVPPSPLILTSIFSQPAQTFHFPHSFPFLPSLFLYPSLPSPVRLHLPVDQTTFLPSTDSTIQNRNQDSHIVSKAKLLKILRGNSYIYSHTYLDYLLLGIAGMPAMPF